MAYKQMTFKLTYLNLVKCSFTDQDYRENSSSDSSELLFVRNVFEPSMLPRKLFFSQRLRPETQIRKTLNPF